MIFLCQSNTACGQRSKSELSQWGLGVCPGPLTVAVDLTDRCMVGSPGETGLPETSGIATRAVQCPGQSPKSRISMFVKVQSSVEECDLHETEQLHQFPIISVGAQHFA